MKDKIDMGMNAPAVKGHCKIEVFEDGKKVKEIEQDNYVHPKYLGALNKFYSYSAFRFGQASFSGVLPDSNWIGESSSASSVPFRGLLLTGAVHAEDPEKERAIRGDIIGMSALNDNNSPQSPYRGRYNSEESEHDINHHKFVYDFREDEANGVIGSVYTVPGRLSGSFSAVLDRILMWSQRISGIDSQYGIAHADEDYVYYCHRSNSTPTGFNAPFPPDIYRVPKSEIPKTDGDIEAQSVYMPIRPVRAMTEKDGRFYMWGHVPQDVDTDISEVPSGNTFIVSAPKNDISNITVEKLWTISEINEILGANVGTSTSNQRNYATQMSDLHYDESTDRFIMMYKSRTNNNTSTGDSAVYILDADFNIVDRIGEPHEETRSNIYDTKTIVMDTRLRPIETVNAIEVGHIQMSDLSASGNTQALRPYNDFFDMSTNNSSILSIHPAAHFFSRVLLTQPINKTNQQTMKITYEFTREPYSLDHIDDGSKYTPCAPEIIQ